MEYLEVISRKVAKARGLDRYFTGKACKHGHISERHTASGVCVECQREYDRTHYTKNKEAIKEYARNYREQKTAELGCDPDTLRNRKKRAEAIGCTIDQLPTRTTPDPARFVYVIEVHGLHRPFAKVGITNDLDTRLYHHGHNLAKSGLTYSVLKLVDMGSEDVARYEESCFKKSFQPNPIDVTGFVSELFELNPFMRRFIENIKDIDKLALTT